MISEYWARLKAVTFDKRLLWMTVIELIRDISMLFKLLYVEFKVVIVVKIPFPTIFSTKFPPPSAAIHYDTFPANKASILKLFTKVSKIKKKLLLSLSLDLRFS